MNQRIFRSYKEPIRDSPSFDERWNGSDKGLITCWEVGRKLSNKEPELSEKAQSGELPILVWKGGVERKINKNEKYGTLFYLAQWHCANSLRNGWLLYDFLTGLFYSQYHSESSQDI